MSKDERSKVVVDLSEELSASELELLRKHADAMKQSLGSHIAWLLFCFPKQGNLSKKRKK